MVFYFFIFLFILCFTFNTTLLFAQEKLNLNTATLEQLKALPGIGEATAKKILELRDSKGGFKSLEELKEVKGIGDKKFEVLKNYLTLEQGFNNQTTKDNYLKEDLTKPIYMYVDERGNIYYTQFPELVPPKYKKTLKPIK